MSNPAQIKIDTSHLVSDLEAITAALPASLESIPDHILDRLLSLSEGIFPEGCVVSSSATTVAGDHVIVLGIGGDLKEIGIALGALERDSVCHEVSPID